MMKRIDIDQGARALLVINGKPERWLAPGRTWVFTLGRKVCVKRWDTARLCADLTWDEARLAKAEELETVDLDVNERAIVWREGVPKRWLQAGRTYVWKVDPTVRVEVLDVGGVATAPLAKRTKAIVPDDEYREVIVPAGCKAVRYVDGVLDDVLDPGRYAVWTAARKVELVTFDLRERQLAVTGQEVMTKDRVTLRLNTVATFKVVDVRKVAQVARDADAALYLAVQVAMRDAVTTKTLDELLAAREQLATDVTADVQKRAQAIGLDVEQVALKDVVLPGDMKELLNRVIEAKKEAEANVILRREEAAATRLLAQTAELLAEQPTLMRLKELEAMKELAERVDKVQVVLGEGGIGALQLKA